MITFAATVLFGKFSTDVLTTLITSEFRILAHTDLMCRDTECELCYYFSNFCKNSIIPCKITFGYRWQSTYCEVFDTYLIVSK